MQNNKDVTEFQSIVSQLLARHRSVLDCLTKHHESTARINRAITKAVTNCGCISINANRQHFPQESTLKDFHKYAHSHLEGKLCESCFEVLEEELGNHIFYLTAICDLMDMDLRDVFKKEKSRLNTLGHYFLS